MSASKARTLFAKKTLAQIVCHISPGNNSTRAPIERCYASTTARTQRGGRNRLIALSTTGLGGLLLALGLSSSWAPRLQVHADAAVIGNRPVSSNETNKTALRALLRSYVVYTMCSIPVLVDNSPKILKVVTSIPILKQIAESVVRVTFFEQFVGGETAQETVPVLHKLRSANKGALFAYSIEVDESEARSSASYRQKSKEWPSHKHIVDEMIRCIDVAADFEDSIAGKSKAGRRTWVAVKISALLPNVHSLIRFSSRLIATRPAPGCPYPTDLDLLYNSSSKSTHESDSLTYHDIASLRELYSDLGQICAHAQERGVKIIIDAEYSWYQPALDALTISLMRRFNKLPTQGQLNLPQVQPLVYGTYQAYLRRTPAYITFSLADAKANHYALGVKLVRGAYHPHELAAHEVSAACGTSSSISPEQHPPVWTTKAETDQCYNECAKLLVGEVKEDVAHQSQAEFMKPWLPSIGVLFGTHNWTSCNLILDNLVHFGLATKELGGYEQIKLGDDITERLTIGQLYGMGDKLTDYLVNKTASSTPLVIKYVPYGALSEVMPYLGRRAIENKSMLGNGVAADERKRAGAEIWKRFFG